MAEMCFVSSCYNQKHSHQNVCILVGSGSHYLSLRESGGRLKNSMFSTDSIAIQMCIFLPAINMKIKTKLYCSGLLFLSEMCVTDCNS